MKIDGLSRNDLLAHLHFEKRTSVRKAHPGVSAPIPPTHTLIGGGFRVNWPPGPGNLATASFPEFGNVWTARYKDHFADSPCTIDCFSISLRTEIPNVGRVSREEDFNESGSAGHVSVTVRLTAGFALTGVGAEVRFTEPGSLLWRLAPTVDNQPGVTASSKDHQKPSPATIKAWAIGIRI